MTTKLKQYNRVHETATVHLILKGVGLKNKRNFWAGKPNASFALLALSGEGDSQTWQSVAASERVTQQINPRWPAISLSCKDLCACNLSQPILVEVTNHGKGMEDNTPLGYFKTNLAQLKENQVGDGSCVNNHSLFTLLEEGKEVGKIAVVAVWIKGRRFKQTKELAGVSVHYLQHHFIQEVAEAGYSRNSSIYELEDLRGNPGIIRRKGADVMCPLSNKKGAAYVHCLRGLDNVGTSTHMLSYTWSYKIGDIIDTLVEYCTSHKLDPTRTYFWICFLCMNQHRVVGSLSKGIAVPTANFVETFRTRVGRIGNLVCMMAPWDAPENLNRIWCIFEMSTAFAIKECQVTAVMPAAEEAKFIQASTSKVNALHALFDACKNTKVEGAQASEPADTLYIRALLEKQRGGFEATNTRVNENLRAWGFRTVQKLLGDWSLRSSLPGTTKEEKVRFAHLGYNFGLILYFKGDYDSAIVEYHKCLSIRTKLLGPNHADVETTYNSIALALEKMGDYTNAKDAHRRCQAIRDRRNRSPTIYVCAPSKGIPKEPNLNRRRARRSRSPISRAVMTVSPSERVS